VQLSGASTAWETEGGVTASCVADPLRGCGCRAGKRPLAPHVGQSQRGRRATPSIPPSETRRNPDPAHSGQWITGGRSVKGIIPSER